jgi:hypothetical protein
VWAGLRALQLHPAGICAAPVPNARTQDLASAPGHHRRAPIAATCPSNEKKFTCRSVVADDLRANATAQARRALNARPKPVISFE